MTYFITKTLKDTFSQAKEKIIEALKKEGFGILTEIDVQATLKKKLDVDFYKYEILGACNPSFAYKALELEDKIGVMLPCNVIIQQKNENSSVEVSAINPEVSMKAVNNQKLELVAGEVQSRLAKVIENL